MKNELVKLFVEGGFFWNQELTQITDIVCRILFGLKRKDF